MRHFEILATENWLFFLEPSFIAWFIMALFACCLLSNLFIAGRNGWASGFVKIVATILAFVLRALASLFREVASSHPDTATWDEE